MNDDRYILAYMSGDKSRSALGTSHDPADAIVPVDIFHLLSTAELSEIREDTSSMLAFFSSKRLLRGLELNLRDLHKACEAYLHTFDSKQPIVEVSEELSLNLGRLLLNLLSFFRSFLDHTETRIKRRYGDSSSESIQWKTATATSYDESFAYRLLYRLRNYAQHLGVPPVAVYLSLGQVGRIELDRDHLLQETDVWNSELRDQLARQPQKIPLFPLLEEWWREVNALSQRLTQIEIRYMEEAARRILRWRTLYSLPDHGTIYVMEEPPPADANHLVRFRVAMLLEQEATLVLAMVSQQDQQDYKGSGQMP